MLGATLIVLKAIRKALDESVSDEVTVVFEYFQELIPSSRCGPTEFVGGTGHFGLDLSLVQNFGLLFRGCFPRVRGPWMPPAM